MATQQLEMRRPRTSRTLKTSPRQAPSRGPADPMTTDLLRDMAFVLHLTQKVKASILAK